MDALITSGTWNSLSSVFSEREANPKPLSKKMRNESRLIMTPELEARIAEAEKNSREGNCISCRNREELRAFLDSL